MTREEREKLNVLYKRVINNCGVLIKSDKWYEETSYEKACLECNNILNRLREIEEYLYIPYNLGYSGILNSKDSDFNDFVCKIRHTNNLLGLDKHIIIEDDLNGKKSKINNIKKKLPLTEAEFDNIKENTFLYYLSILDDKYKFTKLEKLYLMEYVLLRGEPNGKNDD